MLYETGNPHGGDIYNGPVALDFSANTNPYGTPPGILQAVGDALTRMHHYPDPYCRELVASIAAFEGVPKEYILCGNGAAELIYSYCQAVRPRKAAELAPTFSEYSLGLERAGCPVVRYPLSRDNDFMLEEGFLPWLERERPEAVFLCSPNNPTGKTIPPALLVEILDFCKRRETRLFLDECFLDLSDHGISMKPYLAEHPQLFLLKAFTKSYGMAGIRLGYCLCADHTLLRAMSQTTQPWNVSLLAQAAGIAALGEQAFLTRARQTIAAERPWMKEHLERLGFWVCPSEANYLLFHGPSGLHEPLAERQIAIRNCGNYHGLSQGWYRVAVRLHGENEQLISALSDICGKESLWPKIL